MASFQRYVCDAEHFVAHVINKHRSTAKHDKERHYAALKIQAVWRGNRARHMISEWNRLATVIQKHFRGFYVRKHLPEFYEEYLDWYYDDFFNRMATKIQAFWKGYQVRRVVCIKNLRETRFKIEEINNITMEQIRLAFEEAETEDARKLNSEAKKWVIYILYKLHHHLRTYTKEGIYSLHGQQQFSVIEQLLGGLTFKKYMNCLRRSYYRETSSKQSHSDYLFQSRRLQREEDNYRHRDKNLLLKEEVPTCATESKRFSLDPKIEREHYHRLIQNTKPYSPRKYVPRPYNKAKHIVNKDFDLHAYKIVKVKPKRLPYYTNYWTERCCSVHDICYN